MSAKAKELLSAMLVWKLAAAECFLLCLLALTSGFGTTFLAIDEAKWDSMWWVHKWCIIAGLWIPVLTTFKGFISQTAEHVRRKVNAATGEELFKPDWKEGETI